MMMMIMILVEIICILKNEGTHVITIIPCDDDGSGESYLYVNMLYKYTKSITYML